MFQKYQLGNKLQLVSDISAISWREQVNFQRDDDEIRFVLDRRA